MGNPCSTHPWRVRETVVDRSRSIYQEGQHHQNPPGWRDSICSEVCTFDKYFGRQMDHFPPFSGVYMEKHEQKKQRNHQLVNVNVKEILLQKSDSTIIFLDEFLQGAPRAGRYKWSFLGNPFKWPKINGFYRGHTSTYRTYNSIDNWLGPTL